MQRVMQLPIVLEKQHHQTDSCRVLISHRASCGHFLIIVSVSHSIENGNLGLSTLQSPHPPNYHTYSKLPIPLQGLDRLRRREMACVQPNFVSKKKERFPNSAISAPCTSWKTTLVARILHSLINFAKLSPSPWSRSYIPCNIFGATKVN